MRPPKEKNSFLRYPLNNILGYRANLRVLRALTDAKAPLSISSIAERTGLTIPGVHKVVERLLAVGIAQYTGGGKSQNLMFREEHLMSKAIMKLFAEEKEYFESLNRELRNLFYEVELKPDSAWISGKVTDGVDEYGDPIMIFILAGLRDIDNLTKHYRRSLLHHSIEQRYDVSIEIHGVTQADIEFNQNLDTKNVILLWGVDPIFHLVDNNDRTGKTITHDYLDIRSAEESKIWTKLLKVYPEIIPRTISELDRRIIDNRFPGKSDLTEWKQILETMPFQRLKKLLESDSERAVRLRQSIPFWHVLTDRERSKFEEFRIKSVKRS